jgi:hypothetical protein
MKTNNEKTNLNLNSNIEHRDQNKTIRNKIKNMKCANKNANKFLL